jgi:hypothetical protein
MIDGEFPAVPAWVHSGEKPEEQELITGGEYQVASVSQDGDTTVVRLAYAGPVGDRVGTDPLLTTLMGRLPDVLVSRLVRGNIVGLTPVVECLDLELSGNRKLSIGRTRDDHAVAAVAFDPPAGWAEAGDDDYATWANWNRIKKRVELPADADAIVDWVQRETV